MELLRLRFPRTAIESLPALDNTAKIWAPLSDRQVLSPIAKTGSVHVVAYSPDGQRLVASTEDKAAKVWGATSARELLALKGHTDAVWALAFSPAGQRIITSGQDAAKVWEAASGRELLTLAGHRGKIFSVGFSPDGLRVLVRSTSRTPIVWEATTAEQVAGWEEEERAAAR